MSLRVLLDENLSPRLCALFVAFDPDYSAQHVNDCELAGAADVQVLLYAQQHSLVLITLDEDLADTRTYPIGSHAGVVRLRLWDTTYEATRHALERLLSSIDEEELAGSLVIVDEQKIRVRKSARHG